MQFLNDVLVYCIPDSSLKAIVLEKYNKLIFLYIKYTFLASFINHTCHCPVGFEQRIHGIAWVQQHELPWDSTYRSIATVECPGYWQQRPTPSLRCDTFPGSDWPDTL